MPKKPKEKADAKEKGCEDKERSSWSEDQEKRGYYYDDAHGYEVFVPAEDEDDD